MKTQSVGQVSRPKPLKRDHRKFVCGKADFSTGVEVFNLLLWYGLKPTDSLIDIGCGSFRVGRFLMTYLEKDRYFGIEPYKWLVDDAVKKEVGTLPRIKNAKIVYRDDFDGSEFGELFDWVLLSNVLVHKGHREISLAIKNAIAVLKPDGKIMLDYYTVGPHWEDDDSPPYPIVATHVAECYRQRLPEGFLLEDTGIIASGSSRWCLIHR